jgi:hypothetical protein
MLLGAVLFLLLLLALLAIPLTLSFEVAWCKSLSGKLRLYWLFGLVRIPITVSPTAPPSPEKSSAAKHSRPGARAPRENTHLFAMIRQKPLRRRFFRYLRDCWRAIGKKDVALRLRIGLGDPADTGRLWALLGPIAGMLANNRETTLQLEPEFFDPVFELEGHGDIRLIPLQLIYLTLGLLLSAPLRHAVTQARRAP